VEEGRGVFDNLTKIISWTLPTNLGEGLIILVAIFAGIALPILPIHILWINTVTAAVLGLVLGLERSEPGIMLRPPRRPDAPILAPWLMRRIFLVASLILAGAFGIYELQLRLGMNIHQARTVAVNIVVMIEIFYLLNSRSLVQSMFQIGWWSNRWVWASISAMIGLQLLFTYAPFMNQALSTAPLPAEAWLEIFAVGLVSYLAVELEKWFSRRSRPSPARG
jgi:cation-transporting P-type ATPase F